MNELLFLAQTAAFEIEDPTRAPRVFWQWALVGTSVLVAIWGAGKLWKRLQAPPPVEAPEEPLAEEATVAEAPPPAAGAVPPPEVPRGGDRG